MNKNKLIIIFVFFSFACTKEKTEDTSFNIVNNTDRDIAFVYISTIFNSSKSIDYKVEKHKEVNFGYELNDKGDGCLRISYKFLSTSDTLRKDLGYYSNGHIDEKKWIIRIFQDSVQVQREYKEY